MKSNTVARQKPLPPLVPRPTQAPPRAFTRIELLATIAVVALLAASLAPAVGKAKPNSLIFQCLNNARQLAAAFAMYTAENHDYYPPNPDDANTVPGYDWCPGLVWGWMPPALGVGAADAGNPDNLSNPARCLVIAYLGTNNWGVFRCPADPRVCPYTGPDPSRHGQIIPVVRSVSMNQGVGTIDPIFYAAGGGHSGKPILPVNGPWLDGNHGHRAGQPYATFGKATDFRAASPAQIFLLADEDPWSINDASLAIIAATPTWIDYPAAWHDHGCTFSFCDGHVELHKWTGTSLGLTNGAGRTPVLPTDADWSWVVGHATVKVR